ncbi:hypothetical protein P152DRAFT_448865 [Eremomyces bilateralis CBS 781.70]|uniref:Uncharacterized protein n=1 Tax=Eremomyces bilateralis CBS 781.70 TaxID=1392243 RepID=A0A6G1G3R2_9PEZI|nr:uncharacterized protein P152DRAFT_448865 [Eremomyces bilateralis CBS 781.70]KAF1812735.1 hypothetical protein P152DRAFT_448865 [Eremomyces bilateralis CBS 781.70]
MCLADLHLSTLPCKHRYYRLLRPCTPGHNLLNCPMKLALSGWESRSASCPFCISVDPSGNSCAVDYTTYRLITETSLGLTTRVSRSSSLADTRRATRSASLSNAMKRSDSYVDALTCGGAPPPSFYSNHTPSPPLSSGTFSTPRYSPSGSVSSLTFTTPTIPAGAPYPPHPANYCPIATSTSIRNQAALARIDTYFSPNRGILSGGGSPGSASRPDSSATVTPGDNLEMLAHRRGSYATSASGASAGSPASSATSAGQGAGEEDRGSEAGEASGPAISAKGGWSRRDSVVGLGLPASLGEKHKEKGYGYGGRKRSLKEAVRKGRKLSIGLFK